MDIWNGSSLVYESPINSFLQFVQPEVTHPKTEGVEIMELYNVTMVYAEDRNAPVVITRTTIIAKNPEDAKVKSGLMAEVKKEWDSDYLTFLVNSIGSVAVKEKPKEVKNV